MKRNTKFLLTGLLISQILFTACKGPAGDPGPAGKDGTNGQNGAAGAQGVAGNAGANGAQGATGATGTANVIYGNWVDMNVASYWYKLNGIDKNNPAYTYQANIGWGANFAAPITQEILDKGTILIYGKYEASNADKKVYLLPSTTLNNYKMESFAGINRIYLQIIYPTTVTLSTTYSPTFSINQFRYVIIPGSINGRKPAIDYSDYEAVKKYYNLKD